MILIHILKFYSHKPIINYELHAPVNVDINFHTSLSIWAHKPPLSVIVLSVSVYKLTSLQIELFMRNIQLKDVLATVHFVVLKSRHLRFFGIADKAGGRRLYVLRLLEIILICK